MMKTLLMLMLPISISAQNLTIPQTVKYINEKFKMSVYTYNYTLISKDTFFSHNARIYKIDNRKEHDSISITEQGEIQLFVFNTTVFENWSYGIPSGVSEKPNLTKYTITPSDVHLDLDSNLKGFQNIEYSADSLTINEYFYPPTYSINIECTGNKKCIVGLKDGSTDHVYVYLPDNSVTSNSLFKAFKYLFKKIKADPKYKDPFK